MVHLFYQDDTIIYDLREDVILQLLTIDDTILWQLNLTTDITGLVSWSIETPLPGSYELVAQFLGNQDLAPASDVELLIVYTSSCITVSLHAVLSGNCYVFCQVSNLLICN